MACSVREAAGGSPTECRGAPKPVEETGGGPPIRGGRSGRRDADLHRPLGALEGPLSFRARVRVVTGRLHGSRGCKPRAATQGWGTLGAGGPGASVSAGDKVDACSCSARVHLRPCLAGSESCDCKTHRVNASLAGVGVGGRGRGQDIFRSIKGTVGWGGGLFCAPLELLRFPWLCIPKGFLHSKKLGLRGHS